MTTTYDVTVLTNSVKDQVRFHLGDTDVTQAQVQDEEIAYAILSRGGVFGAVAMCARALQAKYARLTSISADGVSQGLNQKTAQFKALADAFERKEAMYRATPSLGGVSKADMRALLADEDKVPDLFRIGMNDNPPSDGVSPINDPALGVEFPP